MEKTYGGQQSAYGDRLQFAGAVCEGTKQEGQPRQTDWPLVGPEPRMDCLIARTVYAVTPSLVNIWLGLWANHFGKDSVWKQ